jgi:hypothetical protein
MTHPNSLDLEAFACGEEAPAIAGHLAGCADCTGFVERLRGSFSAGPSRAQVAKQVEAAARLARPAHEAARRRWFLTASTVAVPLAAAAALLLFVGRPESRELAPTVAPASVAPTERSAETTFKGGIQAAVVRERAGQQTRFTNRVSVKPGDRLRVEVALDREQAILVAVMGDDASWLELMHEGVRTPGTHFSDRSARIDATPLSGTILVGSPEDVTRARNARRTDGLTSIRIEWETP